MLAITLVLVLPLPAQQPAPDPRKPSPVKGDASWFRTSGRLHQRLGAKEWELVFVGDSLTEGWLHAGKETWDRLFGKRAVNLGLSADRVENVHHRMTTAPLKRAKPRTVVVLAGTNNLAGQPASEPKAVADGILALAQTIRWRSGTNPRVIVLSILPSGHEAESELRRSIRETNRVAANHFEVRRRTEWLDVHDLFLNDDGTWKAGLTIDGTHLSGEGYRVLGEALMEQLSEKAR